MTTFNKQPNDVLDYDVVMDDWFASVPGDNINIVEHSVTSETEQQPTLVLGPLPHQPIVIMGADPTRFKAWIGGGTDFTDYKVTFLVKTEQDREKEIEIRIKVRDR